MKYILAGVRTICLMIDTMMVSLNGYLFQLFIGLTQLQFKNSYIFDKLANRLYVLIGIFMVFRVTFSLIQMLANPELMSDKEKGMGKLASRVVISLALLVLTPFIFEKAIEIQNVVLKENIIGQIVLGVNTKNDASVKSQGKNLAFQVFKGFISPNDDVSDDDKNDEKSDYNICKARYADSSISTIDGLIYPYTNHNKLNCLTDFTSNGEFPYTYLFIASTIASLMLAWMVVGFCIDVASRLIKLGFYQIIAPIPIISYINGDKNGPFNNWVKKCISTYISVFVKLLIIYFVIYMCNIITTSGIDWSIFDNTSRGVKQLGMVAVLLGLILFAKMAPKLIKDMFGIKDDDDGGFGKQLAKAALLGGAGMMAAGTSNLVNGFSGYKDAFSSAKTNWNNANGVKQKLGAGLGLAGAALNPFRSAVGGAASGLRRGATTGYAGKGANPFAGFGGVVRATNQARNDRADLRGFGKGQAHYGFGSQVIDTLRSTAGMKPKDIKGRIDSAKARAEFLQSRMSEIGYKRQQLAANGTVSDATMNRLSNFRYDGFKNGGAGAWVNVSDGKTVSDSDLNWINSLSGDEKIYKDLEKQRGEYSRESIYNSKEQSALEEAYNNIMGKTGNKK